MQILIKNSNTNTDIIVYLIYIFKKIYENLLIKTHPYDDYISDSEV